MPLTSKGEKIKESMEKTYGSRAEEVLYRSRNAGTISGIDRSGNIGARGPGTIKGTDTFKVPGQPGINDGSFVPGGRRR